MTSNLNGQSHKYAPGTAVYTKAGLDGFVLATFRRKNGQLWCVCEGEVIWFSPENKIYPHKRIPSLAMASKVPY